MNSSIPISSLISHSPSHSSLDFPVSRLVFKYGKFQSSRVPALPPLVVALGRCGPVSPPISSPDCVSYTVTG